MSSKPRIFSLAAFDRGAKARWLLTELGVEHEVVHLSRAKKEHETPEYLQLNPMGRVPTLQIDGQVIIESGAICAFLADRFGLGKMAPTLESPDRALYQQWLYFAASTIDPCQTRIMIIEDIPAGEIQATKQAALQSDLRDAMSTLDRTLSKSSYLVGNRFTLADIVVSYHTYFLELWPELAVVMNDFPKVKDYLERMKSMPSAIKADVFSYKG